MSGGLGGVLQALTQVMTICRHCAPAKQTLESLDQTPWQCLPKVLAICEADAVYQKGAAIDHHNILGCRHSLDHMDGKEATIF